MVTNKKLIVTYSLPPHLQIKIQMKMIDTHAFSEIHMLRLRVNF